MLRTLWCLHFETLKDVKAQLLNSVRIMKNAQKFDELPVWYFVDSGMCPNVADSRIINAVLFTFFFPFLSTHPGDNLVKSKHICGFIVLGCKWCVFYLSFFNSLPLLCTV